jgi:hypothetical protein
LSYPFKNYTGIEIAGQLGMIKSLTDLLKLNHKNSVLEKIGSYIKEFVAKRNIAHLVINTTALQINNFPFRPA